ncbi:hypothetical protein CDL60_26720 [Roseateles noduli]|nr:hypothetical protein CDL60_26720 [Roseateles noduli]
MESGKGVLVGSITYTGPMGSYGFTMRPVEGTGPSTKIAHGKSMIINPFEIRELNRIDPDFKSRGSLFAVEMPAGRYVLEEWAIDVGAVHVRSTGIINDVVIDLEPGKAVYLGNYHFVADRQFMNLIAGGRVTLTEKFERDEVAFRKRYPGMADTPFSSAIQPGTKIENFGGTTQTRMDPIYVPVMR